MEQVPCSFCFMPTNNHSEQLAGLQFAVCMSCNLRMRRGHYG